MDEANVEQRDEALSVEELSRLDWGRLPHSLRELRALVGTEAAVKLAAECGGGGVYVPRRPQPGHWLSRVVGHENARALAEVYGGDKLEVPTLDGLRHQLRLRRMRRLREEGVSVTGLAREFGLTRRRVFQILADA